MFTIQRIAALQDSSSRNFANEFTNEQGSCATLKLGTCVHVQLGLILCYGSNCKEEVANYLGFQHLLTLLMV